MPDYIPKNDADLALWLDNFKKKFEAYATAIGMSPTDIAETLAKCTTMENAIKAVEDAKKAKETAVETKNNYKRDIVKDLRAEVKIFKATKGYTSDMGKDLGIVTESSNGDMSNKKTRLSAEAYPGYVLIKFTKKGFTGVNIYGRIKGTKGWTFLGRDTKSPFSDKRPLGNPGTAETREYMAIGLKDDDEIGKQSDIVTVAFSG